MGTHAGTHTITRGGIRTHVSAPRCPTHQADRLAVSCFSADAFSLLTPRSTIASEPPLPRADVSVVIASQVAGIDCFIRSSEAPKLDDAGGR
jgi:hypothetical protein